ncbi:MAG: hypothetical protein WA906_04755, partial [Pacificimonas sp.]
MAVVPGVDGQSITAAGAIAVNVITGASDALIDASNLTVGGNAIVDSRNASAINATMAAAAANVTIAGKKATGVAVGAAMAINWIGYEKSVTYDMPEVAASASQGEVTLATNDYVIRDPELVDGNAVAAGGYTYLGADATVDLATTNFDNAALWRREVSYSNGGVSRVDAGDLVRIADGDRLSGALFEYVGSEPLTATLETDGTTSLVDLSLTDYTNRDLWQRKDMVATTAAAADARIANSDIAATGDVTVSAESAQSISATVAAAAVSVAVGKSGTAVGISGSVAVNNIQGGAYAAITGDMANGISASSVMLDAQNTQVINSVTAAASVSAAFGKDGLGISIGLSVAYNAVSSDTVAEIVSADVTSTGTASDDGIFVNAETAPPPSFTAAANPLITADRLNDATATDSRDLTQAEQDALTDAGEDVPSQAVEETDAAADKATIDKITEVMNDQLGALDKVQGSFTDGTVRLTQNNQAGGWTLVDAAGKAFALKLGPAGELNFEIMTINAVSAAASLAIAGGSKGIAVAGAGALALNSVSTNVRARAVDS